MYKVPNNEYNREVIKLQRELIKDLNNSPLYKINLYYYIQALRELELEYK